MRTLPAGSTASSFTPRIISLCRRIAQARPHPRALRAKYTRNITWAEQAVAWNTYLARTSYLLQQGSYVADVAYLYGEGAPAVVPYWKAILPAPPTHYGYDFVNSDVLLHHSSVLGQRLHLDGGMSYRLLVLPAGTRSITVEMLRKLRELVESGITLLAPRPQSSPSLADDKSAGEFTALVQSIWGDTPMSSMGHVLGKGRVFGHGDIEPLLQQLAPPRTGSARLQAA